MDFDTVDKWFKKAEVITKKAGALASETAQKQAAELKRSASQLTGSKLNSREKYGKKELEFADGPLGFALEGTAVASVERGSQADRLGVERGDRLVAVAGYDVPVFEEGDIEGEQQTRKLLKKWMKEFPRPCTLVFTNDALLAEAEGAMSKVRCNAGHFLKVNRKKENFCDICQAIGTQYRCSTAACDWDVCKACFQKELVKMPEAPREESLLPKGEGLAWSLDSDDDVVEDSNLAARIEAALGDQGSDDDWFDNIDTDALSKEPVSSEKAPSSPKAPALPPVAEATCESALPAKEEQEEPPAAAEESASAVCDWGADVVGDDLADELEAIMAAEAVEAAERAAASAVQAEQSAAVPPQAAASSEATPQRFSIASSEATPSRLREAEETCQEPSENFKFRENSQVLVHELQDARRSWAQASASLEAEQKQCALLRKKMGELKGLLAAANDQNKELASASKHEEEATQRAVATEARAVELAKEVETLKAEREELRSKASTATERASATELRFDSFMRELTMVRKAHDAEVELLKREHQEQEKKQQEQIEEQSREQSSKFAEKEEKAAEEVREALAAVEVAKRETAAQQTAVDIAKAEASAAVVEAAAARRRAESAEDTRSAAVKEAAEKAKTPTAVEVDGKDWPKDMEDDAPKSSEVATLYDRINLLERRCCYLQGKLNAKPLARVNPNADLSLESGLIQRPDWEAWLAAKIGAKGADMVVVFYCALDAFLRQVTLRLLKRDMWLWVFYAHLLVLYTIAGTCYSETLISDSGNPTDVINAEMSKATGAPVVTAAPVVAVAHSAATMVQAAAAAQLRPGGGAGG